MPNNRRVLLVLGDVPDARLKAHRALGNEVIVLNSNTHDGLLDEVTCAHPTLSGSLLQAEFAKKILFWLPSGVSWNSVRAVIVSSRGNWSHIKSRLPHIGDAWEIV